MSKTLHTDLTIEEAERRLNDPVSKQLAGSFQLKLTSKSNEFKLRPTFLGTTVFFPPKNISTYISSPSNMGIPRTIVFNGRLIKNASGTTITGRFRYSYLFILFWPLFFGVATYSLYVNSGQQYPWAPIISAIIGIVMTALLFIEPKGGWDKNNISILLTKLFDTKS